MQPPLILLIDDSATIRKMVEHHLCQAGYRVVMAADAEIGIQLASSQLPDLIILDHQLPGITGDEVCRKLLESEATSRIPVLVSSSLRSRAFAQYADFPNVVDQLPKPFTADLLRSGVDNALQTGRMVVQAQWNGSTMPESVEPQIEAVLEGNLKGVSLSRLLDFLTSSDLNGRLTVESGTDRIKFVVADGNIQAVYSPTVVPDRVEELMPAELIEFAPLLPFSLAERGESSMPGLFKLLESRLSNTSRLNDLLRFQSAVLTCHALSGEQGCFTFDSETSLPPLFRANPLQCRLVSLTLEGMSRFTSEDDARAMAATVFARTRKRLTGFDRGGVKPSDLEVYRRFDGLRSLSEIAEDLGLSLQQAAAAALGLEMAGQVERREKAGETLILVVDPSMETASSVRSALASEKGRFRICLSRDRLATKLRLKRIPACIVVMPMDRHDDVCFYQSLKRHARSAVKFIGLIESDDSRQINDLMDFGVQVVVHSPNLGIDLRSTIKEIISSNEIVIA